MTPEETFKIKLSDGRSYTVRKDRNRYFYPDEWKKFSDALRPAKIPVFDFLINTGARIDEALHIRPCDFDFDRKSVRLWKTKIKARKGEKVGKPRTMSLSTAFINKARRYCKGIGNEDYIWMTSNQAVYQMLRRGLSKAVKDPYNFGLHNIRKTHGMWLKAMNVPAEEICLRLGHDYNTYLKHYGSADIFSDRDLKAIERFMDDLYARRRRF